MLKKIPGDILIKIYNNNKRNIKSQKKKYYSFQGILQGDAAAFLLCFYDMSLIVLL